MLIEVMSVPEEYSYIMLHPHECKDGKEGEWEPVGRETGYQVVEGAMFAHDKIHVECKECGAESLFEFKLELDEYRELREALEKGKKENQ